MIERPLGKITALLADIGLEVTYAYDDLVFVQNSAILIQFCDEPKKLKLFMSSECESGPVNEMASKVIKALENGEFSTELAGLYFLTPNEDNTLNIEFRYS